MSVFRKEYRPLQPHESSYLDVLKDKAQELCDLMEWGPNPLQRQTQTRETALAKTNLEQAIMWAVKDAMR